MTILYYGENVQFFLAYQTSSSISSRVVILNIYKKQKDVVFWGYDDVTANRPKGEIQKRRTNFVFYCLRVLRAREL